MSGHLLAGVLLIHAKRLSFGQLLQDASLPASLYRLHAGAARKKRLEVLRLGGFKQVMQFIGSLIRQLTGQCFILHFGGGADVGKPSAPKAAIPAPAAIAPPKELDKPVDTYSPEAERKGTIRRSNFVLGSGRRTSFGQQTTLGAGV